MESVIFVDEIEKTINMVPFADIAEIVGDMSTEDFENDYDSDIQRLNKDISDIRFENESEWDNLVAAGFTPTSELA